MGYIIGIDIGGSRTKIVGLCDGKIVSPFSVKAGDALTSTYGAFGKYLTENRLRWSDISKVVCTGVGASLLRDPIYDIPTVKASEFICVGLGGKFITGLDNAVVVSMGTGTAFISVRGDKIAHVGGSGVGGGTVTGLAKKLIGVSQFSIIEELAEKGSLENVDLTVGDITQEQLSNMKNETTASNFGKVSEVATPEDFAAGIFNLVIQTVGTLASFAAQKQQTKNIILTGHLATLPVALPIYKQLEDLYGCVFIMPENAAYATAIGAAIYGQNNGGK